MIYLTPKNRIRVLLLCTKRLTIILINCLFLGMMTSCDNNDKQAPVPAINTADTLSKPAAATKTIVFFGNSLTAGYGLEPQQAFPSVIQHKIDSLKLNYKVVNAGVSGETTAGGKARIDWILKQPVDVFVLELGGNDGLRGIPVAESRKNLHTIIDKVKTKYPDAKLMLAGMQVPPNMGQQYGDDFRAMYAQLAEQNDIILIPFLLQGVGGEANLNQPDGIHPNIEGARMVAENVWQQLKGIL